VSWRVYGRGMTNTWRALLTDALEDDPTPTVLAYAPDEAAFDVPFYDGYGGSEGPEVLAWTETYVYFPVVYDGAEWIERAPRHPRPEGQAHVGGQ
jgi:hypothetical protein